MRTGRQWILIIATIAAILLFFWLYRNPIILTSSQGVNEAIGLTLAYSLPWLAVAQIFFLGGRLARVLAVLLALPLLLLSVVFSISMLARGAGGFVGFAENRWNNSVVRLYSLSGGALSDWGVEVRQERRIVPGILLVHTLDTFYPCHSLDIVGTSDGVTVNDAHSDCDGYRDVSRHYPLKRFVYF